MNPQTKELFAQALDTAVPETWTTLTPEQLARFAEKFAHLCYQEGYHDGYQEGHHDGSDAGYEAAILKERG
jgi:flagellar biosynthesis/type III secretory pathway protein FliH